MSSAEECPICFSLLSPPSISLACGHNFHNACLEQLIRHDAVNPKCPSCRAAIDMNRLKGAEQVCGKPEQQGGGYPHYAARSMAPAAQAATPAGRGWQVTALFDRLLPSRQRRAPQQQQEQHQEEQQQQAVMGVPMPLQQQQQAFRGMPMMQQAFYNESPRDTDPSALLDAVLPHIEATPAEPSGSNHLFCLDVSGSMADAYMCTPASCSRLALALAYLACYVDKAVAEGDSFCVTTFSDNVHTIVPWQRKGAAGDFDRKQFLLGCRRSIDSLERGGTGLFTAFATGYLKLKEEARVGAGAGSGAAAAAAAVHHPHDSSDESVDVSQLRTQQLVLITDGEATDPRAFERAHELACSPPMEFNFKSFLVKIETSRPTRLGHERPLSALARYPNGEPIPYILHQEFHLPGSIDSGAATTQQAMQTLCQAQGVFSKMQSSTYYQQKFK